MGLDMKRRRHFRRTYRLWMAVMLVTASVCGCSYIKAIAILTAPETEKVDAEYDKLAGKRVVVYAWVPPEVAWDYPKIRWDLATYMTDYLREHVDDAQFVDPDRVERYLESLQIPEVAATELAEEFRADAVVKLTVFHFTMRDPGMSQFYRGRLSASLSAVDVSEPDLPGSEIQLGDVSVAVPEDGKMGYTNIQPDMLRQETYRIFTVEAGKKFHEFERPLD